MSPTPDDGSELVFPDNPDPVDPYPIPCIITVESEYLTGYNSPVSMMYLEEHPSGDIFEQIRNDLRANHGVGYRADVHVYESGGYDLSNVREVGDSDD